ncbi:MAG: hypothetical protein U5K70_00320 [Halodesulfurarchaeum sp.]|nr:hypothetical protein [Halodesulfurarchaeum sp.]
MTADRGISTPIDVVLGLLMVGLAAGVVVTAAPAPVDAPPNDARATILGSSVTVEFGTDAGDWTVRKTVGGLLADAAVAGQGDLTVHERAYRRATRKAITDHVQTHNAHLQLVGVCRGTESVEPLVAGQSPPNDRPIRATVYEVPQPPSDGESQHACDPIVVLRRWSP